jgi:resuscitation-promoting factor RpfA
MRIRMSIASLLVTALAVFSTAATPVPAGAATRHTWIRLAHCESGGRWHANTGNGYYGGLQFSASTWRSFGGRRYARLANHAKPHQQIKVARRVKRAQGWGAWPSCSRKLGLR